MKRLAIGLLGLFVFSSLGIEGAPLITEPNMLFNDALSNDEFEAFIKEHPDYVDRKNEFGITPLMAATKNANIDRVNMLLNHKANPDIISDDSMQTDMPIDKGGNTALHFAIFFGNNTNALAIAIALILHKANVNIANKSGDMPIHYLREVQSIMVRLEILNYLLANGASVIAQGFNGETILHQSVNKNDVPWVEVLARMFGSLDRFDIKNNNGLTPIELALWLNNNDMARTLQARTLNKNYEKKIQQNII